MSSWKSLTLLLWRNENEQADARHSVLLVPGWPHVWCMMVHVSAIYCWNYVTAPGHTPTALLLHTRPPSVMSSGASESMAGPAGSRVMELVQDTLCEVLDFVRESLVVAISACGEEKEQRLDLAWLRLKHTICRKSSLFQHLQVGNRKGHAAVLQHCFIAFSDGTYYRTRQLYITSTMFSRPLIV